MALAQTHLTLLKQLHQAGIIGKDTKRILELGEQNWFGDVSAMSIPSTAKELGYDGESVDLITQELMRLRHENPPTMLFDLVKLYYQVVFAYDQYEAIDLHGTEIAKRYDLNEPVPHTEPYDVVTNFGTSEHVFNQYQFFKTVHELTKLGGLMIHNVPNQGAFDHGFYNYHPTFLFDLAAANQYVLRTMAYVDADGQSVKVTTINREDYVRLAVAGKLATHSALIAVFNKGSADTPFKVPRQGFYDGTLPPELAEAWNQLKR